MPATSFLPQNPIRFETALRRFDEENSHDPNHEEVAGTRKPRELVYAQWLSDWVLRLNPDAGEALRLAARCQHICRWTVPRDSYPMTRAGYLRWREDLKRFHARKAGEILREVGYPEEMVVQVQALNLKQNFPGDPDARTLEDALCLVFLEHQLADLATKTTPEKLISAIRKTWKKMTPAAQTIAGSLPCPPSTKLLLDQALKADSESSQPA